ncbi:tRNA:pseudouridine synthase [Blumeria graminis f. sp. tritici 96224]|uniref:tRNA:pseudouridine synthase n=1 Tax=Blumeria graminis f. sp. tritici 96224 TaxID=1268274 RepID=A0A656KGX9_BLUGR|nr:tRNA:pseudouridine synthase [Blumeria graminis f. sp. tritici 96224]
MSENSPAIAAPAQEIKVDASAVKPTANLTHGAKSFNNEKSRGSNQGRGRGRGQGSRDRKGGGRGFGSKDPNGRQKKKIPDVVIGSKTSHIFLFPSSRTDCLKSWERR